MTVNEHSFSSRLRQLSASQRAAVVLLGTLPLPTLGVLAGFVLWPDTWWGQFIYGLNKVLLVLWPLWWLRYIERHPLRWHWPTKRMVTAGVVLGLAISGVILGSYALVGDLFLSPATIAAVAGDAGLDNLPRYLLAFVFWVTINSAVEEFVWRWFVVRQAEQIAPAWGAVLIAGLGFTAHHVVAMMLFFDWPLVLLASTGLLIGATIWSASYLYFRSLWPAYISHALVDVAVFGLGYLFIFG